jgi:peptidoglycan L-alanyl-D-glutamate endopeptidase CwlK
MDQRSLLNLNTLHPKFVPIAIAAWTEAQAAMPGNVKIIVIQGLRTFAESTQLYAIGRTVKGDNATPEKPMGDIVTKAQAGQSYHNYGLAFDFQMLTNGKEDNVVGPNWMKVVDIMKRYGMTWGGEFPEGFHDDPHFEKKYGYNWRELLAKYNAGDFLPGIHFVKL